MSKKVKGIAAYHHAAGGWGAVKATTAAVWGQKAIGREVIAMFHMNQVKGFDCPGCAWPDPTHRAPMELCENGVKAVTWEATSKKVGPEFFQKHSVDELLSWNDFELENAGRLTHPLKYDALSKKYQPVQWEDAFAEIGTLLRTYSDPNTVDFYTSGRASNEAAYLYQLFAREYGTNNFPDCSNMCHGPTSVGLTNAIGIGKGTVELDDFGHCDLVISIGHNPGTNHPRMLATLREVAQRGAKIISINPLSERGLERFSHPQIPSDLLTHDGVKLSESYHHVKVGGDVYLILGIMKALLEMADNGSSVALDNDFIREHTHGFDALREELQTAQWSELVEHSGISRDTMREIAFIYGQSHATIICYGLGITQHENGTNNVQQLANLLLLKGNMGRKGAGICPLRGHSNVQGDRSVGINEAPTEAFLQRLESEFAFTAPRAHGHSSVTSIQAIERGEMKALFCLGGNLAVAMPDPERTFAAVKKLDLMVHMATKLNRSHLLLAKHNYIFPVLGRTEKDMQASGLQSVTVEDSMSMVHASTGTLKPASKHLRSEPAIIAGLARATRPESSIPWEAFIADYRTIRNSIERVIPAFAGFNQRIEHPGGFRMENSASQRLWKTATGKANFTHSKKPTTKRAGYPTETLMLATLRSHDQYNTTVYGMNDRYRGVVGRRDVLFISQHEAKARGLEIGDVVNVVALDACGAKTQRQLNGLTVVVHDMANGSVGAYYPEANVLLSLDDYDEECHIPAYKSAPVMIEKA
ncbi:MAG TPA: FdhF/YdeP family oxidoreductase [Scandinavium sp.]|jgi:molybdopterin-dependent oxidoreductase alpha subunit